MAFRLTEPAATRRPNLTPLIDVVFILLIFFMLAANFERRGSLPLDAAGSGSIGSDAPRLIDVQSDGLRLNGAVVRRDQIPEKLGDPSKLTVLRPATGVDVQRLVEVMEFLSDAGFENLVVVE